MYELNTRDARTAMDWTALGLGPHEDSSIVLQYP